MRESVQIFIACALGAFIGGLIGLEFKDVSIWLCLPAALVGGVVGWVTYDVRALGAAIARAWHEVISWRPDYLYWRLLGKTLLTTVAMLGYSAALILIWYTGFLLADAGWYTFPTLRTPIYELYWTLFCPLVIITVGAIMVLSSLAVILNSFADAFSVRPQTEADWHEGYDWITKPVRATVLLVNPLVLPFAAIYGCYKLCCYSYNGVRWGIPRLPILGRFAKRAFILAHSNLRLLCLVDGFIGALAGSWFLNHALLGAIAGGIWGLLNYWIVSVKILHLAPARVRNE